VQVGQAAGSLLFGIGAAAMAFRVVGRMDQTATPTRDAHVPLPAGGTGGAALATLTARPVKH
jgi:hypothetical protein